MSQNAVEDDFDRRWGRRCEAIHRIKLSLLYHLKRERFLDSFDRFVTAFAALSATAAAATLYKALGTVGGWFEVILTAAAATLSVVAISYVPGSKARLHAQIAVNMRRLWAECLASGEDWSSERCAEFESRTLLAEEGEPAQLGALVTQCENEIAVSVDNLEGVRVLSRWQSWFKHWWNFDTTRLRCLSTKEIVEIRGRTAAIATPLRSEVRSSR